LPSATRTEAAAALSRSLLLTRLTAATVAMEREGVRGGVDGPSTVPRPCCTLASLRPRPVDRVLVAMKGRHRCCMMYAVKSKEADKLACGEGRDG
jgi:hypothetical protein